MVVECKNETITIRQVIYSIMYTFNLEGIIDSTLREGGQAPGTEFGFTDKLDIIRSLTALGIDEMELDVVSPGSPELPSLVRQAQRLVQKKSRLSLWCRCRAEDIQYAARCSPDVLSLSSPVSDLHMCHRLGRDREWVLDTIERSIVHARRLGFQYVSVGLEDATRADSGFLARVVARAASAGASRIRLADTVGIATPGMISSLVQHVRLHCSLPIGIHTHNDFGMATANVFAALEAGACWADATVLGLGERAGNCRLEELVGYLGLVRGDSRYQPDRLPDLCNLVANAANISISGHHPVVGDEIFTCETGLHVHGLTANPVTYEPFDPHRIGRSRIIRFGGKTGKRAVRNSLASMGIKISYQEAVHLVSRVRQIADERKKSLDNEELFNLAKKEGLVSPYISPGLLQEI
jgi:homocitrate synthase NifV